MTYSKGPIFFTQSKSRHQKAENTFMRYGEDKLYQLFEHHLLEVDITDETEEDFIHNVVQDYLVHLVQEAHIPPKHLNDIAQDLFDEVKAMLVKKTYGHFNLAEYRQRRRGSGSPL